jgi:thiosulfate/3-mercaptopyruvate sulfurtransferase
MMNSLIEASALKNFPRAILLDARGGTNALERYKNGHIKGAVYVDLEKELSSRQDPKFGGRHPLPSPQKFSQVLAQLGVSSESHVIVYDDMKGGNAAARLWWMLRAAGVQNVQLLNGGLQVATEAGIKMSQKMEPRTPGQPFHFEEWNLPTATMHDVKVVTGDSKSLIIDVREAYRFNGESEPIDLIAGHIPGAVNVPYIDNLDAEGKFLTTNELISKYKKVIGPRSTNNVVVHCGSGVTACHTLLAMELAGFAGAKLYVGSWGEWSRNRNEMIVGN